MFDFFLPENEKKLKSALRSILGFSPGNLALYNQSFRHNSIAREIKEGVKDSNERLEFLGDSVLNTVIAEYLFMKYPYKDEGFLTKMRSRIVSRDHLNQLSLKLGLNKFLPRLTDPGIRHSSMNGDAFEALVGAVFLDKGFETTRKFILNRILKFHVDVDKIIETETDFKSKLIEWGQREKKDIRFAVTDEQGRGPDKQFGIAVTVDGEKISEALHYSKKKAEQRSAEEACLKLGIA